MVISWIALNIKKVFQKFTNQTKLYRVNTELEAILQLNSFLNVFIVRFKAIEGYVLKLQDILREFLNIRQLIELGPQIRSRDQIKLFKGKVQTLREELFKRANELFSLQVYDKFSGIISLVTDSRISCNLETLIEHYPDKPIFTAVLCTGVLILFLSL